MLGFIYRVLTDLGAPFISLYLRRRLAAGREDAARFQERLGIASCPRPDGFLVWCHAASVGEAASLLALVEALREHYPAAQLLITTGTVTSARMLANRLPPHVVHQFVPVDRAAYVKRFLDHWKPDLALWVESELWPNLLAGLREYGVPSVLLNGRMSVRSFRRWLWVRGWTRQMLGTFVVCLTQTEAETERFTKLGAREAQFVGNLKYAAAPLPCDEKHLADLRIAFGQRPVWLMASTHQGEEEIALKVHELLRHEFPNLLTIIAPRHAVRGDALDALIESHGLAHACRSRREIPDGVAEIYLVDTMGELGLLYRVTPIVAMGGSFVPWGGHNPIEPAQLGAALIFGPSMFNFAEVAQEFVKTDAALQVRDQTGLVDALSLFLRDSSVRQSYAERAETLALAKRHVLDGILAVLAPWLERAKSS